jgi:flagellar L-ring protein precursor FlgH
LEILMMKRTPLLSILAIAAAASFLGSCASTHIGEYVAKRRTYKSPVSFDEDLKAGANGSLFRANRAGTYLFADHRAMRIGDIVTVRVSEKADAKRGAATDLLRESETSVKIGAFLGLLKDLKASAGISNDEFLGLGTRSAYRGAGNTSRSEDLEATVPALVREVLPSGNLFIEGHRVVLVNNEEHHFYISGLVRPVDIKGDNSVFSSLIADAEIEFTGRGVITDRQQPPWLQKGLDLGRPF